jgi:tetratricopeptide (TPR) repeat protein
MVLLLFCILLAGCRPGSTSQGDEQKDPYFLAGKNRLQERDYQGAVEMFEKALDVNPRSASAHFELGVLYEQQQYDYAASLYHYGRAVMLNSNAPFAELSRQRMQECKRELAKSVVQPMAMQNLQAEIDALRAETNRLKQQLELWQNYNAGRGTAPTTSNPATIPTTTFTPASRTNTVTASTRNDPSSATTRGNASTTTRTNSYFTPRAATTGSGRTHVVASGDTPAAIARRYNIKLSALESANPTMDARRLRIGQVLLIP